MYMVRSRKFVYSTGWVRYSLLESISYAMHGNVCNPLYLHMVNLRMHCYYYPVHIITNREFSLLLGVSDK